MEKTEEFENWRAEERAKRAEQKAKIDAHNKGKDYDDDDYWLYDMPPNSIMPMVMKSIGPYVCGSCLATKDEPAGDCTVRFHKESTP